MAWLYVHGVSVDCLDHIDRDRSNNRIANLRRATNIQNCWNRSLSYNCKSGVRGVRYCRHHSRWVSTITANNRRIHLGYFDTKDDAVAARRKAEREIFGEFSVGAAA